MPVRDHRDTVTRARVEEFLYTEAALLDDWSLDAWLQLYDTDAKYEVPCNDRLDGDPDTDLLLIDDDHTRMRARVERLNNRRAHREYPHSRTNHQIFNVRLDVPRDVPHDVPRDVPRDGRPGSPSRSDPAEFAVTSSFTVWRFRAGRSSCYVGRYRYRLRHRPESPHGLLIALKRVELDMTDLREVSDVAIIL